MTRQELLEQLYDAWWDKVVLLGSGNTGFSCISVDDVEMLDEICEAIEALDGGR